ncbi:hypothetical protein WJX77_011868 [Trebouxia sp. C0004]
MLQALTLSTNLSKTEKPRTKMSVEGTLQDVDQSFRTKTLQTIKASHQSRSSTGSQIARTGSVGSVKTNLATPPGIAATGRLRDVAAARSESRILQDAGLRVSAVKVSLRQPLDPNQGTSVHSPYSTKGPDGKGMIKRKGLVRSATFTAGSADTLDSIPIDADIIGRLGSRGARTSTKPAASNSQQASSMDTSKQSSKRRQVAEASDPPAFSLPHFRASPCLTSGSQVGHSRHGLRPGTPNPKADSLAAVHSASSLSTNPRGSVKIPAAFTKSNDPASQDWPISRWAGGRTLGGTSAAAAAIGSNAVHALHAGRSATAELSEQAEHEAALSRSSSDSSSIAASLEEDGLRHQLSRPLQTIVRVRTSSVQRKQSVKSPLDLAADAVSTSQSAKFGRYAVSSQALSQALKSLGHKNAKHTNQSELVRQQVGAVGYMSGNTVVSCVSASDASQSARSASQNLGLQIQHSKDPLVKESHQVMHWLGMNDAWFEEDFLPFAKRTVLLGHHQE